MSIWRVGASAAAMFTLLGRYNMSSARACACCQSIFLGSNCRAVVADEKGSMKGVSTIGKKHCECMLRRRVYTSDW